MSKVWISSLPTRELPQGVSTAATFARRRLRSHFEGMEMLLRVLTPNRWALLRRLRSMGASSVRALARSLERDYRGVHGDVAALREAGLVERRADGKFLVPWSRITAEMSVDIAA
jgi:predicted transcriptional regulator